MIQYFSKQIKISALMLLFTISMHAQTIEDIDFGSDETFEVVTWNIERFPKKNQTSIDYVARILRAIDADVYAIQEIDDIDMFDELMNALPLYEGYLESDDFGGLAYIYKNSTIQINSMYEIYNTSSYDRPFPRYPMVMDFDYKGEQMIIINNHFKCCGNSFLDEGNNWDEETRRNDASNLLEAYIDTNFTDLNVMLVGDLNDILTDRDEHNVFKIFLDAPWSYKFVDTEIAEGSSADWSFPNWPSHLDHIMITNELFDEYEQEDTEVEVLKVEQYIPGGWSAYDSNITDHRPVALKFKMDQSLSLEDQDRDRMQFSNHPNPFNESTTFSFAAAKETGNIDIYTLTGQLVSSTPVAVGQRAVTFNKRDLPAGVYMARILLNTKENATLKLIVTE